MSKFVNFLDSVLSWASKLSSEPAAAFCELETVDIDGKTLVSSDGSQATVIHVKGSSRLVGDSEYAQIVDRLSKTLGPFMKDPGHTLQVYWVRDPDGAGRVVRAALEGARAQAELLQLNFADVLDEKERELTKWVCHEAVYFVCWTHPGVLSPSESKASKALQNEENKNLRGVNFLDAQNPRVILTALRNRHGAFVKSVLSQLREVNIVAEEMEAHDALREIRYSIDPTWTPKTWRPTLPGDKIPVHFPMRPEETSAVWWPPIGSQVWPRDAVTIGNRYVEIGDRVHAPMYLEIPPQRLEPFQKLIQRAIGLDSSMPFTVSFVMKGGGLRGQTLKQTVASVMAVMSSFNPQIRDSLSQLRDYEQEGSVISLQIAFNTWAQRGKMELLEQRASRMAQAVIAWGGPEVREVTGDPLEGFTSTALGLTANSVANSAAAPLSDVMRLLPITRPASPWPRGSELFTSPDGKLIPYEPGSSLQTTWISIFLGGPGSGKSMQMFKQHLATTIAPQGGVDQIPQISIIDIGPSSSGFASMLQSALPPKLRHLVNCHRIRNTPDFAFNPFDLPLGLMAPLPEDRAYQVDLLTMLATPAETGVPYEGTAELAGMVIDEMYKSIANTDRGKPRIYAPGVDQKVDKAIENHSVELPVNPSWYEVRDALYKSGLTHEAHLAQRYAVPLLSDAVQAARSSSVRDVYGKKLTAGANSETLPEAFSRMLQAAGREYQILSCHTKFDIGESRVTILDLDEVAKSGGPAGGKQTSIMYALAIYMLARSYTMTQDNLRDIPEMFRNYHYLRVQSNSKELKTICCDEFHRTAQSFSGMLRERIKVYGREGRKWRIQLMLGSQRLKDFDDEIIDMATGIFIMERPDEGLVEEYTRRFGLSPTERYALANNVKGPGPGGATFFARMKTKDGYFNQLLRNPAGPIELWAGSTTSEDKVIREMVYAALGPVDGRAALAHSYPGGSAKGDVDKRKEVMILQGAGFGDQGGEDLFEKMAGEVIDGFRKRKEIQKQKEISNYNQARSEEAKGEKGN